MQEVPGSSPGASTNQPPKIRTLFAFQFRMRALSASGCEEFCGVKIMPRPEQDVEPFEGFLIEVALRRTSDISAA